jgi:hypothetical protein
VCHAADVCAVRDPQVPSKRRRTESTAESLPSHPALPDRASLIEPACTIGRDELHAPLETGVREPTPWFDRIEPGANDPRTWRNPNRAIGGGGLRARTEPGETDPRISRDRATGDDWSRGSTEKSYGFLWALEIAIWCLDIMLDALQHIERRTRRERMVQSPV